MSCVDEIGNSSSLNLAKEVKFKIRVRVSAERHTFTATDSLFSDLIRAATLLDKI